MPQVETQIKVSVGTEVKISVATAFLGIALLAAAAVADTVVNIPDLKITNITWNEEHGYQPNSEEDKITVYYKNDGKGPVAGPFSISLRVNPDPGDETRIEQLANQTGDSEQEGAFNFFPVEMIEESIYLIDISKKYTIEGNLLDGLNEYRLDPGEEGFAQIIIPKFYEGVLPANTLNITALIDSESVIEEIDDGNNSFEQVL